MKDQKPKGLVPLELLAACCPEAQADGVPCTSLGRSCEHCQRAVKRHKDTEPDEAGDTRDDSWAV